MFQVVEELVYETHIIGARVRYNLDSINMAEMVVDAGQTAINNGFHKYGEIRPMCETHVLLLSELSEALDELRDGRKFDEVYEIEFSPGKKEGFPVEVADFCIRSFDLLYQKGFVPHGEFQFIDIDDDLTEIELLSELSFIASKISKEQKNNAINSILTAIVIAFRWFEKNGFSDFYRVVREKMAYNRSRPYKHGRSF